MELMLGVGGRGVQVAPTAAFAPGRAGVIEDLSSGPHLWCCLELCNVSQRVHISDNHTDGKSV